MDDYISRQAAIDEMRTRQHSANEWYVTAKSKNDEEIIVRADSAIASFIECILTLKKLPSADVQPHQLTEEDLTELRHRFGNKVERVVRDMISGKEERWMT